jgi:predicted transcriptional regulator
VSFGRAKLLLVEEMERVRRAAERVRLAQDEIDEARAELHASLVAARKAGASLSELARVVGVSRQRIRELVKRESA